MKKRFMFATMMVAMCSTALFTSCGEEAVEGEVEEQFKFGELTAVANADGTIEIAGQIATNTKIKEFALYNADGSVAYDFLEANEQVKEKNKTLDENGKAVKDKSFVLDIKSTGKLPVAIYTLRIKTKKAGAFEEAIGAEYHFNIGTGANTQLGSQFSLYNQSAYMLKDFYDSSNGNISDEAVASKIEVALKGEGDNVSLETAKLLTIANTPKDGVRSQEQCDANKAILADAKIFENAIITTTDCIATYKLTKVDDVTYEISGIVINSKGTLKIDTSAAFN
ncbi:MAG: hypothetical protein IKW86_05540 [Salinivirgaceae bacterium]|nr:hypothetical protein [Salinivirgaceae bacterium]